MPLTAPETALFEFAAKLTRTPGAIRHEDVAELRAAGYDDEEINDAVQIISYFNYINRVADGLGVDLEDFMSPDPRRSL